MMATPLDTNAKTPVLILTNTPVAGMSHAAVRNLVKMPSVATRVRIVGGLVVGISSQGASAVSGEFRSRLKVFAGSTRNHANDSVTFLL